MKPLALDQLLINESDERADITKWHSWSDDLLGLPETPAFMAGRYGRHPILSGIQRDGRSFALNTTLPSATLAAARVLLLQYLNPDNEQTRRFTVADEVIPGAGGDTIKAWFGPWDVWNGDGTWKVRDVLLGDNLTMALDGSWYFEPGNGLQCSDALANRIPNPIFMGTYAAGICAGMASYTAGAGAGTHAEENTIVKYGNQAQRLTHTNGSGSGDRFGVVETTAALGATTGTMSIWFYVVSYDSGAEFHIRGQGSVSGAGQFTANAVLTDAHIGVWTKLSVSDSGLNAAETWTMRTYIDEEDADIIIDGWQLTSKTFVSPTVHGDMPGCTWAGTAHDSISNWAASDNTIADVDLPLRTGTVRLWAKTTADMDNNADTRYLFHFGGANGIFLWINATDDLRLSIGGTAANFDTLTDSNFAVDSWHCIHLVWDIDVGVICYLNGLKLGSTLTYYYPIDDDAGVDIGCLNATNPFPGFIDNFIVLDTAMTAAEALEDYGNGREYNPRYVNVICEGAKAKRSGSALNNWLISLMRISGDVRLRQRAGDYAIHVMRGNTYDFVINNPGDDDARPILSITPRTTKTDLYAYKVWIPVKWRVSTSYTKYPVDICNDSFDTNALIPAKMQADGDDLRVMVDGLEVDRWLDGINTATTKVWVNLDFEPNVEMTLKTAIAGAGDVDTIEVNEDITDVPYKGILYIGTEAFTYTSKNKADRRFLGVTREAKGTSAAVHAVDDDVFWIQHDIIIAYGNSTVSAPSVDSDYKPAFELDHSTNTSWVYEEFGENDGQRTGQWIRQSASSYYYGGNHGASANPWIELGLQNTLSWFIREYLFNPCEITNANFTNGETYNLTTSKSWDGRIESSEDLATWINEYTIPDPIADDTWAAWNRNEALTSGALYVSLTLYGRTGKLEAADCTVTLDNTKTPVIAIGSEQGNYELNLTIENETTEDEIVLAYNMELDSPLIVNTDEKTIIYETENQNQALTQSGGVRRDWLPLNPGDNTIALSDTDTAELDVEITFDRRQFE